MMRRRTALPTAICLAASVLLAAPALSSPARAAAPPGPATGWLARAAGLGTYHGPVIEKDFPATSPTQMMPANQAQAYPWIPYNKIATAPVQLNSNGQPFFNPAEEVSDIGTAAEVLTDQPVTFTEPYFPTRLLTDVGFMILGNRGGDLSHLKYAGLAKRPVQTILGGDGLVVAAGLPIPGNALVVPFYRHLDVGGLAAGVQNNAQPAQVSTALTHFILTGVPGPRSPAPGHPAS